MNHIKFIIVLIIVFKAFWAFEVAAGEINWLYFHYPPLYNIEDEKISGYGMHVQQIISNHMPEYAHIMVQAQPARVFEELKKGGNYIAYGPAKTPEREKYLYYSLPCRLVFTDCAVMNKDKAQQYLIGTRISLQKLLADKNLIMGHTKEASYGNTIDGILKNHKNTFKQEIITGEESEIRQLKMLKVARIDWMIWDPLALKIFFKDLEMQKHFEIYEIYEQKHIFVYAYIVAPKNLWGKQVIIKINTILKAVIPTEEFYFGLSKWVPNELEPSFRKGYEEFIVKPAIEYTAIDQ